MAAQSVRQGIRSSQPESVYFLEQLIKVVGPYSASEHTLACDLLPYFSTASMHVVLEMPSLSISKLLELNIFWTCETFLEICNLLE